MWLPIPVNFLPKFMQILSKIALFHIYGKIEIVMNVCLKKKIKVKFRLKKNFPKQTKKKKEKKTKQREKKNVLRCKNPTMDLVKFTSIFYLRNQI